MKPTIITLQLGVCLAFLSLAVALPPGFVDEGVARIRSGSAATFFPNTRTGGSMMLVGSKEGDLYALEDPDNSDQKRLIMNITNEVCSNGERGLQSIAAHPDFETNRWMYMFYTTKRKNVDGPACQEDRKDGPRNRLSRVKMLQNNNVDLSTEEVLLETSPLEYDHHNGGAMAFGNDGYLYVAIGNGGSRSIRIAQNLGDTLGKVLRITDDGKIPPDNPHVGSDSARCNVKGIPPAGSPSTTRCQEIWAAGLRNPFRFVMDPATTDHVRFYLNDVGGMKWEEISEGGTKHKNANYGWPGREGPCALGSFDDCANPPAGLVDPLYYYAHNDDGGAVTGGAFVPPGLWPSELELDGRYLFNEFVNGEMHVLREGADECRSCNPPMPKYFNETFHKWPRLVDLFFGPYKDTQALYYTSREGRINVRRIVYKGGDNDAPTAVISASTTSGVVGTVVEFDGSGSFDANGDALTYQWDFSADGKGGIEGIKTTRKYNIPGTYVETLTVTDELGFRGVAFVDIVIGTPPEVEILSPADGVQFAVGEVFTLTAAGADADGVSLGDSSFVWEVRQHHNTHYHPFLSFEQGNNVVCPPAPEPEDFFSAATSYLEIIVYATDAAGLTATSSRIIQPKTVTMEFDTEPSGLTLTLDEYPITTPMKVLSWENQRLRADIPIPEGYVFHSWSHGEEASHVITVPAAGTGDNLKFVARVLQVSPSSIPSDMPSSLPSLVPSVAPSIEPSLESAMPSLEFSQFPSLTPSIGTEEEDPSMAPISSPTSSPISSGRVVNSFISAVVALTVTCLMQI